MLYFDVLLRILRYTNLQHSAKAYNWIGTARTCVYQYPSTTEWSLLINLIENDADEQASQIMNI